MIVGIAGKAGAGKDTIGDYLIKHRGFVKVSFAFALKKAVAAILNCSVEKMDDRDWREKIIPELGVSPRYMMQTLGTEWGRQMVNENIWVHLAMERAKLHESDNLNVVITDVRFPNEVQAIQEAGGIVIWVSRPNQPDIATADHASESAISQRDCNFWVVNDASIKVLEDWVSGILHICQEIRSYQLALFDTLNQEDQEDAKKNSEISDVNHELLTTGTRSEIREAGDYDGKD